MSLIINTPFVCPAQHWIEGKGGKQRLVPLGTYAREALTAYLVRGRGTFASKGRGTPAIFLNQRGSRLSRQSAWSILRAAADRYAAGCLRSAGDLLGHIDTVSAARDLDVVRSVIDVVLAGIVVDLADER